jgi:hypothetical protein
MLIYVRRKREMSRDEFEILVKELQVENSLKAIRQRAAVHKFQPKRMGRAASELHRYYSI